MFQLSNYIYALLNVTAVTSIATGGVAPLLAEQKTENFVNYSFGSLQELTKDNRVQATLKVDCYANNYGTVLQIFDAVNAVLKADNASLVDFDSQYLDETNNCVASAIFNIKRKI